MGVERTFFMAKPDAVAGRLVGEIISRLERKGLQLEEIRNIEVDRPTAELLYSEHLGKPFYDDLVSFITSGSVVAMEWSGESAVSVVRALMGPTDPRQAPPGTIRGDFGLDVGENLVHGSDSAENAQRELQIFFGEA